MHRQRDSHIDQRTEQAAAELVERIDEKSMSTPVVLFLCAHKPLAFIAGQFMLSIDPLVGLFDLPLFSDLAKLLNTPGGIEIMEDKLLRQTTNQCNDGGTESERAAAGEPGIVT